MANITTYLLIILSINTILFLGQLAVSDIAAENGLTDTSTLIHCKGSLLAEADVNGCADEGNLMVDTEGSLSKLPGNTGSISPTTGNFFTDAWSSIKSWFQETTGLNYFTAFVSAVPNFLSSLGLPQGFSFVIGAFWNLLGIFLIVMMLRGGGD